MHKGESTITLEERVLPAHLEDNHAAAQLVERLGWAILDAEQVECTDLVGIDPRPGRLRPQSATSRPRLPERQLAA